MGLINSIFGRKKDLRQIFIECRDGILQGYGLKTPTDAQLFNVSLGLAIASVGVLNELGGGRLRDLIDKVTNEARYETTNLSFIIADIAQDQNDIDLIISEFPVFVEATKEMRTNGGAVFPILFNKKGPRLVREIAEHSGGPMGPIGYAAIVIGDLALGREESKSAFMHTSMILTGFIKEISGR